MKLTSSIWQSRINDKQSEQKGGAFTVEERKNEISGAMRGIDTLYKVIDKARQRVEKRLSDAIHAEESKPGDIASVRAELAEIKQTIAKWRYVTKGRRSDLDQAYAQATEDAKHDETKNDVEATQGD